jgi:hypothetical protein
MKIGFPHTIQFQRKFRTTSVVFWKTFPVDKAGRIYFCFSFLGLCSEVCVKLADNMSKSVSHASLVVFDLPFVFSCLVLNYLSRVNASLYICSWHFAKHPTLYIRQQCTELCTSIELFAIGIAIVIQDEVN